MEHDAINEDCARRLIAWVRERSEGRAGPPDARPDELPDAPDARPDDSPCSSQGNAEAR